MSKTCPSTSPINSCYFIVSYWNPSHRCQIQDNRTTSSSCQGHENNRSECQFRVTQPDKIMRQPEKSQNMIDQTKSWIVNPRPNDSNNHCRNNGRKIKSGFKK